MSYLRTNYRITGARVNAATPGSNAGAYAGTGYMFVSAGGTLFIWKNTATYLYFSAVNSGSAADL